MDSGLVGCYIVYFDSSILHTPLLVSSSSNESVDLIRTTPLADLQPGEV